MKRQKVERETPEFAAMVRRMIRAYGRRVANESEVDLGEMAKMAEELEAAMVVAVAGMRRNGFSWAYIADGLGCSRQSAWQRFAQKVDRVPDYDYAPVTRTS